MENEQFMPANNFIFILDDEDAPKIINSAQPIYDLRDGSIIPCTIAGIEINDPFEGLSTYYLKSDYLEDNVNISSKFGKFFIIIIEPMRSKE